jgi:hypothetical protein
MAHNAGYSCPGCGYMLADGMADRCPECGRNVTPVNVIARYRERHIQWKREIFLSTDRLIVRLKKVGGSLSEAPILLSSLDPNPIFLRTRNAWFSNSAVAAVSMAVFAVISYFVNQRDPIPWILWALGALGGVATLIAILTFKPIEFARFASRGAPGTILFDVGRVGPDAVQFDEFVAKVREQIRTCTTLP